MLSTELRRSAFPSTCLSGFQPLECFRGALEAQEHSLATEIAQSPEGNTPSPGSVHHLGFISLPGPFTPSALAEI